MGQAKFHYDSGDATADAAADLANNAANDASGGALTVSVFADRAHLRDTVRDDARAAGFNLGQAGDMGALLGANAMPLGEVILVDCPVVGDEILAALERLDMRAARHGVHLIISTSVQSLDDVFACLDQANLQILVEPTRADRVIALGNSLGAVPNSRLRELSEDDRLALLRLTEQVGQIAERLDHLSAPAKNEGGGAFRFESPGSPYNGPDEDDPSGRLVRAARPPLPDPRLVRRIIRQRQLRARFFDGELFADPAWDMLLDLTAARVEHARVSVTSLCIASGVPPTTALRWITQMIDAGLLQRVEDETDKRRAFITLTDKAADAMAQFFAELGKESTHLI